MRPDNRLLVGLAFGVALFGCEKPIPPPKTAVTIPIAETTKQQMPEPAARMREGIRLDRLENFNLHTIDGAVLVTSRVENQEGSLTRVYVAKDDTLENDPALAFGPGKTLDEIKLAGHLPDALFALADLQDEQGSQKKLLRHGPTGWVEQKMPEKLRSIVSFANGVYGLITDPSVNGDNLLMRLDQEAPTLALPKGEGTVCDTFYTKSRALFPKLAVQPRGMNAAFGSLFVFGMGCDAQVAAAAFSSPDPKTAPSLFSIPAPMFFDGFAGKVAGKSAADFWYFRRPMRPMAQAGLFHFDGKSFAETKWPTEDPQAEDIAVDEDGTLWAVIDGKLFALRPNKPFQEKQLPQTCEARSLAYINNTKKSLWVACQNAVARVSTTKNPEP